MRCIFYYLGGFMKFTDLLLQYNLLLYKYEILKRKYAELLSQVDSDFWEEDFDENA